MSHRIVGYNLDSSRESFYSTDFGTSERGEGSERADHFTFQIKKCFFCHQKNLSETCGRTGGSGMGGR